MEMRKHKAIGLYLFFLRYFVWLCLLTVLWFFGLMFLLGAGIKSGCILPANDVENALKAVEKQAENDEKFDAEQIPFYCNYALFDENKRVLSGNMTKNELDEVQMLWKNSTAYTRKWYKSIEFAEGICVISYDMQPHFSSATLHKLLPHPQAFGIVLFFAGFLCIAVIMAVVFGRKLNRELEPILAATDAIKRQELQFSIRDTKIREFNRVLDSMKDISVALEDSLKEQFTLMENRKKQISAITHDIKTPLTIIKGNTEILQETALSSEEKELLSYIHAGTDKIETCLELLIEAAKAENAESSNCQRFKIADCIEEIGLLARAQCQTKDIVFMVNNTIDAEYFFGDKRRIIRAVSNILDNAVSYTKEHGRISLLIGGNEQKLTFIVEDSGRGFSNEALRCATQEFYTEQKERSGKHYGLGLFIAESVAKMHHGKLEIGNKSDGSGAVVKFSCRNLE